MMRTNHTSFKINIRTSRNYFTPGTGFFFLRELASLYSPINFAIVPMTILPLRRLYIERQVQPELLSFVSTEEVDLFIM
jgi:hypothetical protein